jgi:synaptobrevin family protein YKT6
MKLFFLILFDKNGEILEQIEDMSNFGFFDKKGVKEFFVFISRTSIKRAEYNKRVSITENTYKINCFKNTENGIVTITDEDYQERPLFMVMYNVIKDYNNGERNLLTVELIKKLQNPRNYDKISEIQNQLDETVEIMHDSIHKILERGENLDDLVERSHDLSICSKKFYKESKKYNSCCTIN